MSTLKSLILRLERYIINVELPKPMINPNADSAILLPILKKIPLFKDLDENSHKDIISRIMLTYYPQGYILIKQGEIGDKLYIVKNGLVEIFKEPSEEGDLTTKLAEIGEGGFFGEMALVSNDPRNASAKTLSEAQIFILNKSDFDQLMTSNSSLAEQISAAVVSRLNQNDKTQL